MSCGGRMKRGLASRARSHAVSGPRRGTRARVRPRDQRTLYLEPTFSAPICPANGLKAHRSDHATWCDTRGHERRISPRSAKTVASGRTCPSHSWIRRWLARLTPRAGGTRQHHPAGKLPPLFALNSTRWKMCGLIHACQQARPYPDLRQSYEADRRQLCCEAWNNFFDKRWKIMSLGMRKWAHGF